MTDREALAAALGRVAELEQPASWSEDQWQDLAIIEDAALERLAQLSEQCATCGGSGRWTNRGATEREWLEGLKEEPCPTCHGSGEVYLAETVERIARALYNHPTWAPAVLDALNEESP